MNHFILLILGVLALSTLFQASARSIAESDEVPLSGLSSEGIPPEGDFDQNPEDRHLHKKPVSLDFGWDYNYGGNNLLGGYQLLGNYNPGYTQQPNPQYQYSNCNPHYNEIQQPNPSPKIYNLNILFD